MATIEVTYCPNNTGKSVLDCPCESCSGFRNALSYIKPTPDEQRIAALESELTTLRQAAREILDDSWLMQVSPSTQAKLAAALPKEGV